jgi:thiol:disulfide interchange protein
MLRKYFYALFLSIATFSLQAQVLQPAKWSISASESKPAIDNEIVLEFRVIIDQDWYLYSTDFDPELGPNVTTFEFEPHESYSLVGEIQPVGAKKKYDEIFEGDYTYFVGEAIFQQKVKINSTDIIIVGTYDYQVCSDIDGKCISFNDSFDFSPVFGTSIKTEAIEKKSPNEAVIEFSGNEGFLQSRDVNDPYSLLTFMVVAFLAGLTALLTPCVFPMIPMTVTFFTRKNGAGGKKMAIMYGFFIILIYTIIGSLIAPFMGPEVANELATGWLPNIVFFLVFLVFALSFLGLFEITLPSGFVNAVDQKSEKGGIIGVFFMAFTLVLVSFSCTGPIVGSILVESAGGLILKPILGMFAFSLAFALPFSLFALFPEWMSKLPKSGGWLNSVKVVLGFLELALAFKFLSIADQAYHWRILDREVYLIIWIVIFSMLGLYLLGKLRLSHDSPLETLGVPRLLMAMVTFSFVLYMIPGLFGAPLKAMAGYLPPMSTHDFSLPSLLRQSNGAKSTDRISDENELCEQPLYAGMLHLPHGLQGYFDYNQALECAKAINRPLFIDFTGHGCVNCREMEARVWSDPSVLDILANDFVVVALYVDDKTVLPEEKWYTSPYDQKVKKTIGHQNADFQITRFQNNAQPFYVILDGYGELVTSPKAYDLDIESFKTFLIAAKNKFETL